MKRAVVAALREVMDKSESEHSHNDESEPEISPSSDDEAPPTGPVLQVSRATINRACMAPSAPRTDCSCALGSKCLRVALDSGCTKHLTNIELDNSQPCPPITILDATGSSHIANTTGTLHLTTSKQALSIPDIIYCPHIDGTLLSAKELMDNGYTIDFKRDQAVIKRDNAQYHFPWSPGDGLFVLHCALSMPIRSYASHGPLITSADLSHYRFGHFGNSYLHRAGIHPIDKQANFCYGCATQKLAHSPKKLSIDPKLTTTIIAQS